jgi:hypothetical protein
MKMKTPTNSAPKERNTFVVGSEVISRVLSLKRVKFAAHFLGFEVVDLFFALAIPVDCALSIKNK